MIRHILLVRARDGAENELLALFDSIAHFRGRLPGLLAVTSGASRSPEDLERGFTHGLVVDFADRAALLAYAEDPEHQAVGALIRDTAVGGIDGLLVVDLDLG